MNLIFLGPPGSGKGTQAKLLADRLNIIHISSGELLRQAAQEKGSKASAIKALLEKGQFVPFDTVLDVIVNKINYCPRGFILDGTPRDLSQAKHMDWFFKKNKILIDSIIFFDLPDEVAIKRLLLRARLENRTDDSLKVIKERLNIYHQRTAPVIDYYKNQNKLTTISALPDIDTIHQHLASQLKIS